MFCKDDKQFYIIKRVPKHLVNGMFNRITTLFKDNAFFTYGKDVTASVSRYKNTEDTHCKFTLVFNSIQRNYSQIEEAIEYFIVWAFAEAEIEYSKRQILETKNKVEIIKDKYKKNKKLNNGNKNIRDNKRMFSHAI